MTHLSCETDIVIMTNYSVMMTSNRKLLENLKSQLC